jgi:hypothetical protein
LPDIGAKLRFVLPPEDMPLIGDARERAVHGDDDKFLVLGRRIEVHDRTFD